ncbi:tyrosine recombinase XerC [Paracoccus sp. MC1862]|uniref:site-specific integrase n=1 Tax=Paracoccus sp. MC1862 TaxID=2760307 RepID=UPI001F3E1A2D|nr:tyrosine-type recombinase/integrase [Paracoccus sp. MC1862]
MSADQKRIWINPRKKAVANFIEQIDDLALDQITRDHMLDFRKWWSDRVSDGEVSTNSANKEIGHLSSILFTVNELKRLGLNLPLGVLTLKKTDQKNRPPFSNEWIKTKLLAPGALDGLNIKARNILRVMVNTGARPSEVAALLPAHIHLSAKVPFIEILPEGRHIKSLYSKRKIPLVGVSLAAMRECKDGFSRYRNKPGLSATINKFLSENGLKESPGHVLYSLRHSFEDRMLAAGIDERIRRDLLEHRLNRERYGAGASLEHVHQLLQAIAL